MENISIEVVAEDAASGFLLLKCEKLARITEEFGWISGIEKKKTEKWTASQKKQIWFTEKGEIKRNKIKL